MHSLDAKYVKALSEWREVLGEPYVLHDRDTLSYYNTATFKTSTQSLAILRPSTVAEVQQCVRIACAHHISVYPISRGKNWGYGSHVPVFEDGVIISLERMDAILHFDEELGYITVQPGTTFQQVYDYLLQAKTDYVAPAIGSSPGASLIGNALERGIGKGIYSDRFANSSNLQVVLPNGECLRTGFGAWKDSKTSAVYKWGVGPSIDGLFAQSSLGIVTEMTFFLQKRPNCFVPFYYLIKEESALPKLLDALQKLRAERTIETSFILANDLRLLSIGSRYPWESMQDITPLARPVREYLRKSVYGAAWLGEGAILAASPQQARAQAARIRKLLKPVADNLIFMTGAKVRWMECFAPIIKRLIGVDVESLTYFYHNSSYLGKPMERPLRMVYWRKKSEIPATMRPNRDACGVFWIAPVTPWRKPDINTVIEICEATCKEFGYESNIGLNMYSERCVVFTIAILYDREIEGEDANALACYKSMQRQFIDAGYPPYRYGIQSMPALRASDDVYTDLLVDIKRIVDPDNIMAPGHYGL